MAREHYLMIYIYKAPDGEEAHGAAEEARAWVLVHRHRAANKRQEAAQERRCPCRTTMPFNAGLFSSHPNDTVVL
jgi:hypothetical protein